MRVIAGTRRSLPLKSVPGLSSRPTQDRIKETLFNMLQPYVSGSIFLDLFCGTGGIGIEALSRGAKKGFFVEKDRKTFSVLTENLKFTKFTEESVCFQMDTLMAFPRIKESLSGESADIIFMDPPYYEGYYTPVLNGLLSSGIADKDTLIIAEADKKEDFSFAQEMGYQIIKEKIYKTNKHVWLRIKEL